MHRLLPLIFLLALTLTLTACSDDTTPADGEHEGEHASHQAPCEEEGANKLDGCNYCTCIDGHWKCSHMPCPDIPDTDTGDDDTSTSDTSESP